MIYWIGPLDGATDAELISGIGDTFEVIVKRTLSTNTEQSEYRAPDALVLGFQGNADADAALLESAGRRYPGTPIVLKLKAGTPVNSGLLKHPDIIACIDGSPSVQTAIRALLDTVWKNGHAAVPVRSRPKAQPAWRQMLVGESPAIETIAQKIALIANRRSTVLITGETGSGKEVVARAIHAASTRSSHELVTVNCGALPESLLEAELFGHAKGAFTGAVGQRIGRFEQAHRGTIFLDEIGDMPLNAQTALLRVLQDKEFHRVGGVETVHVDVRVIAATNVDMQSAVQKKTFRPDLLYRLHVFPIHVPPLRARLADVEPLAEHFIRKVCNEEGLPLKRLSGAAVNRLSNYHWPGNVRQLAHAIETALVMSGDRPTLLADDFTLPEERPAEPVPVDDPIVDLPDTGVDFEELVNEVQRGILQTALKRTGGNKSRAASLLNIKRSTLVSKVKALAG
jgi:DNA-binding NtrC family response regulator